MARPKLYNTGDKVGLHHAIKLPNELFFSFQISFGFTTYTPQSCTTSANSSLGISDIDTDVDLCSPSSLHRIKSTNVKSRQPLKENTSWVKKVSAEFFFLSKMQYGFGDGFEPTS